MNADKRGYYLFHCEGFSHSGLARNRFISTFGFAKFISKQTSKPAARR